MADVTINYKGSKIAEMSGTATKTLGTSGKYCEGDVSVSYAPRGKTYEITLTKASGWVLLTTLDADVLSHMNDESLIVSLINTTPFEIVNYCSNFTVCGNNPVAHTGTYPVYGQSCRNPSSTVWNSWGVFYPANNTGTSTSLGGCQFRLDGSKYYARPGDGYYRAGTYRLTFTW